MTDPDPRWVIGVHEAAHVVVGYCMGLTPKKMRIATGTTREAGSAWFAPAPKDFTAFADAIVSAAADIAEVKEFGRLESTSGATKARYGDPAEFGQPGSDRLVVNDAVYVNAVSPEDRARAARIAAEIIECHWSSIRSLAKELMRWGIVTEFPELRYMSRWDISNPGVKRQ